jgi:dihydropteroate synthase
MVQVIKESEKQDVIVPLQALSDARQCVIEAITQIKPHPMCKFLNSAVTLINDVQAYIVHEQKQENQ